MSGDGGGFLRSPSTSFASTYSTSSGGQSRADEPAQTPQQRDEDQARADLMRAGQLAAEAKKLDQAPAHEWQEQRDQIAKRLDAFTAQLQTPQVRSEAADRDREKTAGAVAQARDALAKAKPPRGVAGVAGEDAIAESVADKSIGPEAVIAWMADLSHAERQAVWRRYQDAAHGDRKDPFAVALVNYVGRHRIADDLRGLARMTDRQLGAWRMQPPAAGGVEPDEPIGQSKPLDPLGQSRPLDPAGQSFAAPSSQPAPAAPLMQPPAHDFGAAQAPAPLDFAAHAAPWKSSSGSDHGRQLADLATGALADLRLASGPFLTGFATARDQLRAGFAARFASDIAGKLTRAIDTLDQLAAVVDPNAPGYTAPTGAEQGADLDRLTPPWRAFQAEIPIALQHAAAELGPHRFAGREVLPGAAPLQLSPDPGRALDQLTTEAGRTVDLIAIVASVRDQWAAANGAPSPDLERQIAAQLAQLASRPAHFAFARAALTSLGLWDRVAGAKPQADPDTLTDRPFTEQLDNLHADTRTLAEVDHDATAQAQQFGPMTDLGDFDYAAAVARLNSHASIDVPDDASDLPDEIQGGAGEEFPTATLRAKPADARAVFEQLTKLDSNARGAVLARLSASGDLQLLAGGLGPAYVEQLHDDLPRGFRAVRGDLAPYFQYRDKTDHSFSHYGESLPPFMQPLAGLTGWTQADVFNFATFGFIGEHDQSYRAERKGLITADEHQHNTGHAMNKAALVGVISSVTGGLAASQIERLTAQVAARGVFGSVGAGRILQSTLTGAGAGAVGNMGARAGSDLAEGNASSLDEYAHDAMIGGAIGGALGGGAATLGEAGAMLPDNLKARAQRLTERFPDLPSSSEIATAIHKLAARSSQGVVRFPTTVAELLEAGAKGIVRIPARVRLWLDDAAAAIDVGPQFATPGGPNMSRPIPIDVEATAAQSLHEPGVLNDGPALNVMHAERLADEFGGRDAFDLMEGNEPRRASFADESPELADDFADDTSAIDKRDLPPRYRDLQEAHEDGITVRTHNDSQQAGIVPDEGVVYTDQHHVFPDEHREWLGDPKNVQQPFDVDDFTLDIEHELHGTMHAGRGQWDGEWNARMLTVLKEAKKHSSHPFTIEEMKAIARRELARFDVPEAPYRRYTGTKDTAARRNAKKKAP